MLSKQIQITLYSQGDENGQLNMLDGNVVTKNDSDSTDSESESGSEDISDAAGQSPVSGSINYFVAPLDSSETQAMVIEELNQVGKAESQYTLGYFCHKQKLLLSHTLFSPVA